MTHKVASHFVGLLFLSRDIAHKLHLSTRSFAEHSALGGFYETIVEQADKFSEQYQGYYLELLDIPFLSPEKDDLSIEQLKTVCDWIGKNRAKICSKEETVLQNTIDEIEGSFYSLFYKLTFLK